MTKTPNSCQEQAIKHPTVPELKAECKRLLDQISRRPIGLKLLSLAKAHLTTLSEYKTGRSQVGRNSSN